MVMREVRTEGSEPGKREQCCGERRGWEGLSEKGILEMDLRHEPREHLKKVFLAVETAGAKALG